MPHTALSRAAATLVTLMALVGATLAAPTATAADGGERQAGDTSSRAASAALSRAQTALAGRGGDATMALRDLWLKRDSLSSADRAAYAKLAGRPVKTNVLDSGNIRVHYTPAELTGTFNANDVLNTSVHISQLYSGAGYRTPKPDQGLGGSNATDIYVDSLPSGLYGYCTTDQQTQSGPGRFDVWAYCVVDNDYAGFPANTPLENLQVTVAHEYFHATQFAYDVADDGYAMEATAAWVEDEAYDSVDDNRQYLADSPITDRKRSMDKFGGLYHYGVWIFFRYLTETFPKEKGGLPEIILDFWKAADSSKGAAKDKYFTQGMGQLLGKGKYKKLSLDKAFSLFADANRRAKRVYDEGQANNYPERALSGQKKLGGKGSSKTFTAKLDHLTSATYRYTPKASGKLKVTVSGPLKAQGTRAVVSIWKKSGKVKQKYVAISANGRGAVTVPFASSSIAAIEVTLVNASTRYTNCYVKQTPFSCSGKPTDENKRIAVTGKVV
jgi:hypothetical protein